MSISSQLTYDFSCLRAAALCLGDCLDRCVKRVFFNPQQTVPFEHTVSYGSHLFDSKVAAIASASAVSPPKIFAPLLTQENSLVPILIEPPRRARGKSVQFDLPSDAERVEKAKLFIFASSPSFKEIMSVSRLHSAYRAFRSDKRLCLNSNKEIMAPLIYLWLQATCGESVFHHIPELDSKIITEAVTYEGVRDFGSLFNDERANYRFKRRHILDLENWILHTPYSDGIKKFDSIAMEYNFHKTSDLHENKQVLRNLLYQWLTALYREDIYLDIPKLRNHYYITAVSFPEFAHFGAIFYEEMNRFRADKGFVASQAQ